MSLAEVSAMEAALHDAERDVVAVVLYAGCIPDVALELASDDFGDVQLRTIWQAIRRLHDRGEATDAPSVAIELDRRTDPAVRVGRNELVGLAGEVSIRAALPTYVAHVREAAERRRWRENAQRLLQASNLGDIDLARQHAVDAIERLGRPVRPAGADVISGLDLTRLDNPPTPLRFLVADRITETSLTVLGSKPGVGKSWLSQSLAIAVARGEPWLGHTIGAPRPVLYLDAENGAALAEHRLRQLGARGDLAGQLVYNTDLVALGQPDDLARFAATIDKLQPGLVVVDTLASHDPAAETDTESASRFYGNVWARVRAAGASMLLLHHLRKSLQGARPDDMLDAFRGAGHIVGAAHRVWHLEAVSPGKPVFILRKGKPREFPLNDHARISVVDDGTGPGRTTRVELDGTLAAVEDGYDSYLATVLTYLDATGEGRAKDLLLLPGAPAQRTANDYLTRAVATKALHKPKRGIYTRGGLTLPEPTDED
jgi:RecA/RadA recombinase